MKRQECEQLTLFQEASHASRSALPGSEEARKMTVTSGLKCLELYRNSGPIGLLVRMLLGSSIWHSTKCALTWKTKVTPSKRLLFRLVPSTPRTGGTDAPLLPTITRFDATCGDLKGKEYAGTLHAMKLIQAVKMWPTPKASDCKGSGPVCDWFVGEQVDIFGRKHNQQKKNFCDRCGQMIDWESVEKETQA